MVKHGIFTLLMASSGQEWQFDIPPDICGHDMQFHIATDI